MILSIIVAAAENNAIGKNNGLPWHMPGDMKFFKNTTWGMPLIMGRKTFESLNSQPLPGRMNIVITRQQDWKAEGVVAVQNLKDALFVAADTECSEVFVIGGGEIFKETISKADKIYLTRIHTMIDGDVFLPEIKKDDWKLTSKRDFKADAKNAYDYSFEFWEKS